MSKMIALPTTRPKTRSRPGRQGEAILDFGFRLRAFGGILDFGLTGSEALSTIKGSQTNNELNNRHYTDLSGESFCTHH
jgi:hypothetical protein